MLSSLPVEATWPAMPCPLGTRISPDWPSATLLTSSPVSWSSRNSVLRSESVISRALRMMIWISSASSSVPESDAPTSSSVETSFCRSTTASYRIELRRARPSTLLARVSAASSSSLNVSFLLLKAEITPMTSPRSSRIGTESTLLVR